VVYIVNHHAVKEAFFNCMGFTVSNSRIVKKWEGYERKQSVYPKVLLQLSLSRFEEIHAKLQSEYLMASKKIQATVSRIKSNYNYLQQPSLL
jgi:hypothetical protein